MVFDCWCISFENSEMQSIKKYKKIEEMNNLA